MKTAYSVGLATGLDPVQTKISLQEWARKQHLDMTVEYDAVSREKLIVTSDSNVRTAMVEHFKGTITSMRPQKDVEEVRTILSDRDKVTPLRPRPAAPGR